MFVPGSSTILSGFIQLSLSTCFPSRLCLGNISPNRNIGPHFISGLTSWLSPSLRSSAHDYSNRRWRQILFELYTVCCRGFPDT